ncbi:MAG: phosphate ABC transporter permease subunit PstC [Planctomycetota bacterium]
MSRSDRILTFTTIGAAVVSASILVLVLAFLSWESLPALRQIGVKRFLTDTSWHPLSDQYSLVPMMAATLLTSIGAMLIAAPVGIASAIFMEHYAPPGLSKWYRRLVELLAGIPSVVFGLWGLVVLVPLIARLGGSGQNLLSASLVLGLMILPTIALTASKAIRSVSANLVLAGFSLGLDRWAVIWRVVLPDARRGIGAGLTLALARALGETMAVLMLAGNVAELPDSPLSPARTLTANIALEMGYATSFHRSILFVSGLALMCMAVALLLFHEWVGGRRRVN